MNVSCNVPPTGLFDDVDVVVDVGTVFAPETMIDIKFLCYINKV